MKFSEMPYSRPDIEAMQRECTEIAERLRGAASVEEARKAIVQMGKLSRRFETMMSLVEIRHTIDTRDARYAQEQDFFDEATPRVTQMQLAYY